MDTPIFVLGAAITDLMGFPVRPVAQSDSVPGKIRKAPGGVGRNLAENLVRLGLPVELITAFGDDSNGRALLKHCQEQQIGIRHSVLAEGHRGALHLVFKQLGYCPNYPNYSLRKNDRRSAIPRFYAGPAGLAFWPQSVGNIHVYRYSSRW